jgi:hypothetical protein
MLRININVGAQLLERAIERNAYLVVALRHVVAELHASSHADRATLATVPRRGLYPGRARARRAAIA